MLFFSVIFLSFSYFLNIFDFAIFCYFSFIFLYSSLIFQRCFSLFFFHFFLFLTLLFFCYFSFIFLYSLLIFQRYFSLFFFHFFLFSEHFFLFSEMSPLTCFSNLFFFQAVTKCLAFYGKNPALKDAMARCQNWTKTFNEWRNNRKKSYLAMVESNGLEISKENPDIFAESAEPDDDEGDVFEAIFMNKNDEDDQ